MLHAQPTSLLQHRVRHDHVAESASPERGRRVGLDRQRALDVHRAPAVEEAVGDGTREGRMLPGLRVARGDHVQMGGEHHARAAGRAAHDPDHVAHFVDHDVVEAEAGQLVANARRDLFLVARERGDPDQILGECEGAVEVGTGKVGARGHAAVKFSRGRASAGPEPRGRLRARGLPATD